MSIPDYFCNPTFWNCDICWVLHQGCCSYTNIVKRYADNLLPQYSKIPVSGILWGFDRRGRAMQPYAKAFRVVAVLIPSWTLFSHIRQKPSLSSWSKIPLGLYQGIHFLQHDVSVFWWNYFLPRTIPV